MSPPPAFTQRRAINASRQATLRLLMGGGGGGGWGGGGGRGQVYSRLSTTRGHITDCKLDSVVYAGACV